MTTVDSSAEMARPQGSTEAGSKHPYAHIVVALDGSSSAEQVLEYVKPLARALNSRVTCVTAVEFLGSTFVGRTSLSGGFAPPTPLNQAEDEIRGEDEAYLARLKQRLAGEGLEVECEVVEGAAADAIVAFARTHQADLIAMTTHGHSRLGRALLGSVAEVVVRTAPCPVLVIRNPAQP